jgi:trimeric autotransporter adhesin
MSLCAALVCLTAWSAAAAPEYRGQVTFAGFPVPGATVTATQGDKKFTAVTDQQGVFSFPDVTEGKWTITVEMQGFATRQDEILIAPNAPPAPPWELKMLPLEEMKAEAMPPISASPPSGGSTSQPASTQQPATAANMPANSTQPNNAQNKQGANAAQQPAQTRAQNNPAEANAQQEGNDESADGFLINGSSNNGASSPFAQLAAFGNNRRGGRGLYNGGFGIIEDNSALNANAFSLTGLNTPKPIYNQLTAVANFGGLMKIPHILRNGPNFFVGYQWTRNGSDTTQPALVPTIAQRGGDLSQTLGPNGQPLQIFNPATGQPFAGNMVPVSTQAQALLNLYPLPNIAGNSRYNYQTAILSDMHQDALNSRLNRTFGRRDILFGSFAFQDARNSNPNVFGWVDTNDSLGLNLTANWIHRFSQHLTQTAGFRFSRLATQSLPFWEKRENISGEAGITGNNQQPMNWGPPTLAFSSGIQSLTDALAYHNRNQTPSVSYSLLWNHRNHNITFGGDYRRQEFNYLSQQNPRGTFTFTGAATEGIVNGQTVGGSDLADFLLGIPDTSAIAFGNADKYFRENAYDAYVTDDWRVNPQLTINAGMRWEYGAPITELFGRLVNLDIAPNFTAVAPVLASNPVGPLTGQTYPNSLLRPDHRGFEPRIGISWRPISGSSLIVRTGYGINYDTSVYQSIALQMAQQAPLSTGLSVQNSPACPLTLANGFSTCPSITPDTFAVDPNFKPGYVQTWRLEVQRDLPGSLVMTITYLGSKGTHGVQEFLPNTYPIGAVNPCPTCPTGFAYLTSYGNSTREAGQFQLRRRLHNGLVATAQYTYSKSIDDDSAFGGQLTSAPLIAQNWLDLTAERGLSPFDQRHLLNTQLQYTTGQGIGGKTLMSGWKGRFYKEWTLLAMISVGSGTPQTPIYLAAVPGTGVTGTIRPDVTGAPLYAASAGLFLNPAAYTAPLPGQWGSAGRDSIIGPAQFSMNASMARTFRLSDRFNLDLRFDATNILNHVTYTSWYTTIDSPLFGSPSAANQMRIIKTTLRVRF